MCTTILVGKKASYDGSTLMARNEDSPSGEFSAKKLVVISPEMQPKKYKSVLSGFEMELPDNPMRYTAMPNADSKEGIWAEAGVNSANVAMSATETLTSNYRVTAGDPFVKNGIGEEDMVTLVLPYIHSAREGVLYLGSLLEKYGTYERNGIGFQDKDEIWWLETIGGHHWMAVRVKDDSYVVVANQQGIDCFDFVDAFSSQKENLCSADLIDFIVDNHLDLSMKKADLAQVRDFAVRDAFGTHSDSDHVYNTPRIWAMERYLNPTQYKWDGEDADFNPQSDNLPFSLVAEKKITIDDIKYVLSSTFQLTKYDPYSRFASEGGKYRPVGVNRNNFVAITQLRDYVEANHMALQWLAVGSNPFNSLVCLYSNVDSVPSYYSNTTNKVSTDNFYWTSRLIGALADSHYGDSINEIERYQLAGLIESGRLINQYDKLCVDCSDSDVAVLLAKCNQQIADYIQKAGDELLAKLVYIASMAMKNGYNKSDY
ncbi:MAG: C69 family dipeptidase [Erysipelotrichaceae bacterium]